MSKYNSLKPRPSDDIYGGCYTDTYADIDHDKGKVTVVHGFPNCPECGHILVRDFLGIHWYCDGCGTVWTTRDLIQAIRNEAILVTMSIRNLED